MFLGRKYTFLTVWFFAWRTIVEAAALSAVVWVVYTLVGWKFIAIPFLPISVIGTAVAVYVGLKNNSSYERLWEARRIWGAITNVSRTWAGFVLSTVGRRDRVVARELVYRQIAWANALRLQLRRRPAREGIYGGEPLHVSVVRRKQACEPYEETMARVLDRFAPTEASFLSGGNVANLLMLRQAERLGDLRDRGVIDGFEHAELMRHVAECLTQQGGAERIKTFPFPRQYAIFSTIFVRVFSALLPFGMVGELSKLGFYPSLLVVPLTILITWVFATMELVGDASEDPFEGGLNDVPLSAICRNIEIDLREMLQESDLPERVQPVEGVLL